MYPLNPKEYGKHVFVHLAWNSALIKFWLFTPCTGTWLSEHNHNYYPNFRKQYRYPYQKRKLEEELPIMKSLEEEERPTYFQRISKENGLLGLSVLHRLYPLYGFDVLRDTVFDAMHLLPLNVVKNNIERWISEGYFSKKDFDTNLAKMPLTTGTCMCKLFQA